MLSGINEELAFPILARRPQIIEHHHRCVTGRRVLVTGAGGSIGSELVMQIAGSHPEGLVILDHSELNLYEINCTVTEAAPDFPVSAVLTSVRDRRSLGRLFDDYDPEIVFHAAALKHVPLLENDSNLLEAVLTNVGGTINVTDACLQAGAEMVLVSTDKAVNPSSAMGATKRAAEIYVQGVTGRGDRMCQVRFGNVLGSSGSVVPLFRRQIAQGGPVTVTDPEMTRYLMTIKEAVSLMLEAATLQADRSGFDAYVLDMGDPVKILDLAEQLIRMSGLRPGKDIAIEIVGVRPGEKLHEELAYAWEDFRATSAPRVTSCRPSYPASAQVSWLSRVVHQASLGDVEGVRDGLGELMRLNTQGGVGTSLQMHGPKLR